MARDNTPRWQRRNHYHNPAPKKGKRVRSFIEDMDDMEEWFFASGVSEK